MYQVTPFEKEDITLARLFLIFLVLLFPWQEPGALVAPMNPANLGSGHLEMHSIVDRFPEATPFKTGF